MCVQVWRVSELLQRLLAYLWAYLDHPFQNVRDRVSSVLVNVFETDLVFPLGSRTRSPHIAAFIKDVMPRLQVLLHDTAIKDVQHMNSVDKATQLLRQVDIADGSKDTDAAIRLFKTVCKWIVGSISRTNFGAVAEYYELFPLACLLQSYESDEELSSVCDSMLALLAQSLTLRAHMPAALTAIEQVAASSSWSARAACAEFLQVFVVDDNIHYDGYICWPYP